MKEELFVSGPISKRRIVDMIYDLRAHDWRLNGAKIFYNQNLADDRWEDPDHPGVYYHGTQYAWNEMNNRRNEQMPVCEDRAPIDPDFPTADKLNVISYSVSTSNPLPCWRLNGTAMRVALNRRTRMVQLGYNKISVDDLYKIGNLVQSALETSSDVVAL